MAMDKRNFYAVMGVPRTASTEEIKSAYRELAMQYHPDRNPGNKEAEEKFKEAAEAYKILSDPKKRTHYDQGHRNFEFEFGAFFAEDEHELFMDDDSESFDNFTEFLKQHGLPQLIREMQMAAFVEMAEANILNFLNRQTRRGSKKSGSKLKKSPKKKK